MASMEAVFENARKGHVEFFTTQETLQQYIISVDEDQRSLLHNAVTSGKPELVQYLLQHGAAPTVNAQDEEGWSALHSAVSCGFEKIVEMLLGHGADVDILTSSKRTPMHYAASKGHVSLLRLLLKHGAAVNVKDAVGFTPLHRAAAAGKLNAVRMLIDEAQAVIDAEDKSHKTPIVVAAESQNESIVLFLTARGANLDVQLEDGTSVRNASARLTQSIQDVLDGRMDVDDLT